MRGASYPTYSAACQPAPGRTVTVGGLIGPDRIIFIGDCQEIFSAVFFTILAESIYFAEWAYSAE